MGIGDSSGGGGGGGGMWRRDVLLMLDRGVVTLRERRIDQSLEFVKFIIFMIVAKVSRVTVRRNTGAWR